MSLVDHHRVAALGELGDLVEHVRELLQGGDDDLGLLPHQRVGELLGVLVDLHHHTLGVFELVDRVLQLTVQHQSVGDHDDLVEHLGVRVVVQIGKSVADPGDRVRLPRPRRVLHHVVRPGALCPGCGLEAAHRVPLVVAGEDRHRLLLLGGLGALGGHLHVHEPGEQVEPGVALPHLLPQVRGAVPSRRRRVPCTTGLAGATGALVERQEPCRLTLQPGRHRHPVGVDREVHHRPLGKRHVPRVAILAVLGDRVLHVLMCQLVLQLRGGGRDAIHQQRHVERVLAPRLVPQLASHRYPIRRVLQLQVRCQPVRRLEVGELDGDAVIHHPVTQHVHRAPSVELRRKPLREPLLRSVGIVAIPARQQLLPRLRLGRADEGVQLGGVQTEHPVEVIQLRTQVAANTKQRRLDRVLKPLLRLAHAATPGTSSSPVTAAVMSA